MLFSVEICPQEVFNFGFLDNPRGEHLFFFLFFDNNVGGVDLFFV